MSHALFEKGRESFLAADTDFAADTMNMIALDLGTADTGIKAITGATNATPIVITATSHGFANGDTVIIGGVGGNLSANGKWKVANQAANTFELTRYADGTNSVGSAAYTSGGYAVCLGPSGAGDFLDDFSAARVGSDQTLGTKTVTSGVADAADPTFTSITGATIEAVAVYESTGAEATSPMIAFYDGKIQVVVSADAASSATTLWVEPLAAGIPNSSTLVFSNGVTATMTALAAAGARSLTVSALPGAIAAGNQADVTHTSANLPFTPNGGNLNVTIDSGNNRLFKL